MTCADPHVDCTCDTCGDSIIHEWQQTKQSPSGERDPADRRLKLARCPNEHTADAINLPRPTGT